MKTILNKVFASIQRCIICQRPTYQVRGICVYCSKLLPWLKDACHMCALPLKQTNRINLCRQCLVSPILKYCDYSRFCFKYSMPISYFIKDWKFNKQLKYQRLLEDWLSSHIIASVPTDKFPDAVLAVPCTRERMRQRGFNQALELSKGVAKKLRLPRIDSYVIRCHQHSTQAQSSVDQRRENLRNAFKVITTKPLPQSVALIDDVLTTGATLESLAYTLKQHGVYHIAYWGLARVIK